MCFLKRREGRRGGGFGVWGETTAVECKGGCGEVEGGGEGGNKSEVDSANASGTQALTRIKREEIVVVFWFFPQISRSHKKGEKKRRGG